MSRLRPLPLAFALLAFGSQAASASTAYGDLNNFDTVNDTGQTCRGFEIEIDGAHSTDITYTYDWNHYGAPKITEDIDPITSLPRVFVRYESPKNPNGTWVDTARTDVPSQVLQPTDGHFCTDPTNYTYGCEHFGVGYYGAPTAIKYHWLIDDGAGNLAPGPAVNVATPSWTYNPPVLQNPAAPPDPVLNPVVQPAEVLAVIPAPEVEIPAGKAFGAPVWMKVIKTTTHNANPVALADLISDDVDGDGEAEWRNNEPDEVESEWKLVQNRADDADAQAALAPDDMGDDGSEVVTRRYEFYEYNDPNPIGSGSIDAENGEAMCDAVAADGIHGVGTTTVTDIDGEHEFDCGALEVVGNYIGAQMAAFAAEAPLGLVDHLQPADTTEAYTPRTVVVGGNSPYTITLTAGSLPPGMMLADYTDDSGNVIPGVLSGTPGSGGSYAFTVQVTDDDGTVASKDYTLEVTGPVAPQQFRLDVGSSGTGSGTISVNGIDCGATCNVKLDAGTTASLIAAPAADSVFAGWGGVCSGTADCSVTMDADAFVSAAFDKKRFTLTVARAGGGTGRVSGGGIDCGSTCTTTQDIGTQVTLNAAPDAGMVFSGWSGACTGTAGCAVTLDADTTVTATFAPAPPPPSKYTLSVVRSGPGSVKSKPRGISCGTACSASFATGSSVTLTAKPANKKNVFLGWSGACSGTQSTCTVTMNGDKSVSANFK